MTKAEVMKDFETFVHETWHSAVDDPPEAEKIVLVAFFTGNCDTKGFPPGYEVQLAVRKPVACNSSRRKSSASKAGIELKWFTCDGALLSPGCHRSLCPEHSPEDADVPDYWVEIPNIM